VIVRRTGRAGGPLSGVRVVDLTRILAGPFCTMRLGDLGAEVIKIEQPGSGDETRRWGPPFLEGESAYYLSVNRNKKSVAIDLKSPRGKAVLTRLIRQSDILVENFRSGVMAKLGFDAARLARLNRRLITCSITGYDAASRRSRQPSYDLLIQGESGLMDLTGAADGPPTKIGLSLCDIGAGMLAVGAITTALYRRERTGEGERIAINLLDATMSLLAFQAQIALTSDQRVSRLGNLHPTLVPYQAFRTKDGYLNVAVVTDDVWRRFCRAIGKPSLGADRRFARNADRVKRRTALDALLEPVLGAKSSAAWLRAFTKAGVPAGKIRSVREALAQEKGSVATVRHPLIGRLPMAAAPSMFATKGRAVNLPPPLLGEHTDEVLRMLGM
jgi:crotonobetainyl-CoA:carnitine CoA-transferase CaiB-like acyl-CoA transferase